MRYPLAIVATVLVLAGCSHHAAPAQGETPSSGGNFLPMYLDIISGKAKPTNVCEAHTLEELLMPCETGHHGG
jgi:hypothetical protein